MLTLCATGHRPDKLGGYSFELQDRLNVLAENYIHSNRARITLGISGMALGWDQAWAQALTNLGIPWVAAVPFRGQENTWPRASQLEYGRLLSKAAEVVIVSPGEYHPSLMQVRNEWMVKRSQGVIALWDGSKGGTANCIRYAQLHHVRVKNLWKEFCETKTSQ